MFLRNRRNLAGAGLQRVSGRTGGDERARRMLRGSDAIACDTAPAEIAQMSSSGARVSTRSMPSVLHAASRQNRERGRS